MFQFFVIGHSDLLRYSRESGKSERLLLGRAAFQELGNPPRKDTGDVDRWVKPLPLQTPVQLFHLLQCVILFLELLIGVLQLRVQETNLVFSLFDAEQ